MKDVLTSIQLKPGHKKYDFEMLFEHGLILIIIHMIRLIILFFTLTLFIEAFCLFFP